MKQKTPIVKYDKIQKAEFECELCETKYYKIQDAIPQMYRFEGLKLCHSCYYDTALIF